MMPTLRSRDDKLIAFEKERAFRLDLSTARGADLKCEGNLGGVSALIEESVNLSGLLLTFEGQT